MKSAVRIAIVLFLGGAAAYAIHTRAIVPLRCASAASDGAAALRRAAADRATARRVRNTLRGCECVTSAAGMRIRFTLAEAAEMLGEHREAIAHYQHALLLDRRPEIYFALGMVQLDARDRAAAVQNLARACAFDPARLAEIPYDDVREETARIIRAQYGARWLR